MLTNLLDRVRLAGIEEDTDLRISKYIRLVNAMALIFCSSDITFMFIFWWLGSPEIILYLFVLNLFFLTIPILNHYKYYITARVMLLFSLYGGICFFSTILGRDSLIDIIYVSILTVPFVITCNRHSPILYLGLALSIGLFWIYNHTSFFEPWVMDHPPTNIKYPITLFIFILLFLVLSQMKKSQDLIEEQLNRRAEEVKVINNKLIETNGKLQNTVSELQLAMNEREILMREIHHRVKNNMQIIHSLLNLQSKYTAEDRAKSLLRYSQHRITSMAMVHELLYKSDNLAEINCKEYMDKLVRHLIASMTNHGQQVEFQLKTPEETMTMDIAIPLGLLVNEIITNSLKHGFIDGRKGEIFLELKKMRGECLILIGDNGVGYTGNPSEIRDNSLGMLLINNLVEQLNGSISKLDRLGTHYDIRFKSDFANVHEPVVSV